MKRTLKRAAPAPKRSLKKAEPEKPKRSLVQKVVEKKVFSGPIPTVPKGWKWKGDKHERFEGKVLVAPDAMPPEFPRPHRLTYDSTYWVVDPKSKGKELPSLVTITIEGTTIAWWNCTVCLNHATRCVCKVGFIHPRSIEWIAIRDAMKIDGLASNSTPLDIGSYEVTSRGVYWYKAKETGNLPTGGSVIKPRPLTRKVEPAPKKTLSRKSTKPKVDVTGNYDSAASKSADDMTKALTRQLSKPAKKTLKRK